MSSTIIPALRYADAAGAIEFLTKAFGFEARMVVEGEVAPWSTPNSSTPPE